MRLPPARATNAIAIATSVAWALVALSGFREIAPVAAGFIPGRFTGAVAVEGALPAWSTPFTSALLHADLMHLGFNMLMLVYCGRFAEAVLGARGIVLLYTLGAVAAAAAQFALSPDSASPMIGASGAISAIVGAYALLYGEQRRASENPKLNLAVQILWLAAGWVGLQLLMALAFSTGGTSIAIGAHVGGFLAGLALAYPLLNRRYRRR